MPRNAIATGLADYILPPEQMPQNMIHYVQHAFGRGALKVTAPAPKTEKDLLSKIFILLRARTGHDFSHYKQNTISRRISRRMTVHQVTRMGDYVRFYSKIHRRSKLSSGFADRGDQPSATRKPGRR
jgi:two-component system CheB/CheR fusion protein